MTNLEPLMEKAWEYAMKDSLEDDQVAAQLLRVANKLDSNLTERIEHQLYVFHLPFKKPTWQDCTEVADLLLRENAYTEQQRDNLVREYCKQMLLDAHFN